MKVCALDLEMNQKYPLAIGLALGSKDGKLICIVGSSYQCLRYPYMASSTGAVIYELALASSFHLG